MQPHWFFDNRVALLELRIGQDVTFATLILAGLLTVMAGLITVRLWDDEGLLSSLWTLLFAFDAAHATYRLAMVDTNPGTLGDQAHNLVIGFGLMLVMRLIFGNLSFNPRDIMENLTMFTMAAAVATKTMDMSNPASQPQLYNGNILLVILSIMLLLGLGIVYIQRHRAQSTNNTPRPNATPTTTPALPATPAAPPAPPATGANFKKNL